MSDAERKIVAVWGLLTVCAGMWLVSAAFGWKAAAGIFLLACSNNANKALEKT